ncbi:hypothetical protein CHUAL_003046 [Chamberlinius hualienensis]
MEAAFIFTFAVFCAWAIVTARENGRQFLLAKCCNNQNSHEEFEDKIFVCPWSPTHRVIGFSSTPGIYRIERHPVYSALYDLLYFWECKTKTTILIIDNNSGLSQQFVERLMKRIPATDCNIDIINVDDTDITVNGCQLIGKYRYIVFVGRDNIIQELLLTGNSCTEKSPAYTTWIIVSSEMPLWLNREEYVNYVNPLRSQMTVIIPQIAKQETFSKHIFAYDIYIYDVFRSNTTNKLERIKFAQWSSINGLMYSHILTDSQKLRGRILRLTYNQFNPYVILNENKDLVSGSMYEPFKALEQHLNVQYILIPPKEYPYGIDVNGSLTGTLGMLQRGEADFIMGTMSIRDVRMKAAYFGTAVTRAYMQMTMPRPSATVPPTVYISPFDKYVWLTIAGGLLVIVSILALTIIVTPHNTTLVKTIRSSKQLVSWILSGQFLDIAFDNPSGWAVKWTYYVILTATMTVFIYYTSMFTSFLTYKETKLPFETYEEMAEINDYQIVLAEGTAISILLQQSRDEKFKRIWKRITKDRKNSLLPTWESAFQKVFTGKYVYIGEGINSLAMAKGSCNVIFLETAHTKEHLYMTFRRDFPYIKMFSNRYIRLMEAGVTNRWTKIFNPESASCEDNLNFVTFNMNHVFTLFIVLFIGIIVSLSILAVEIIVNKRSRTTQNKRK